MAGCTTSSPCSESATLLFRPSKLCVDHMRAVLEEIGYAHALLARQDNTGQLILIDGHLRADFTLTQDVLVLILDVTEAEANNVLATLDPLASLAELDTDAWTGWIAGIDSAFVRKRIFNFPSTSQAEL